MAKTYSKTYLLHGKHVSEEEFTEAVVDILVDLSKRHPGNIYFGQSTLYYAMFYKKREEMGEDWRHWESANPQQIKEVLDKEAEKEGKEKRVKIISIPREYSENNFKGSRPTRVTNYYRAIIEE